VWCVMCKYVLFQKRREKGDKIKTDDENLDDEEPVK
jgi:hypothetical protein